MTLISNYLLPGMALQVIGKQDWNKRNWKFKEADKFQNEKKNIIQLLQVLSFWFPNFGGKTFSGDHS